MARRTRQRLLLTAGIASGVLGFTGSLPGLDDRLGVGLGAIGLVLAVTGAIGQHRHAGAYVRRFSLSDWAPVDGALRLVITAKEHGMGRAPMTKVMQRRPDGTLEQVEVDVTEDSDSGDVTLVAVATADGLDGEVRIS